VLDRALELGVTHWDTANSYNMGAGNSERMLGRYFASRGSRVRGEVILASKVRNAARDEHEMSRDFSPNETGASRRYIVKAVEDSLTRLQTEWLDVLYHHAPNVLPDGSWETPLEETWDALDQLVTQGKVRYLAVSNRNVDQLEQECNALEAVGSNSSRRIVGVQNKYSLMERDKLASLPEGTVSDEAAFLGYVRQKGIGVIPHTPLALGLLAGRYRKGDLDKTGRLSEQAGEPWRGRYLTERNLELVEPLLAMAEEKGCALAQLAIAWLLAHEEVCSVIAGVTKMEHLESNVKSVSVSLTDEELEKLDELTSDL
jgi:aryl-alcohol dehydrogenase-like predicted oxidoreductase